MGTHETVEVLELPYCDTHPSVAKPVRAHYDGKTRLGPWGYMCEDCFQQFGMGLGLGRGQ